MTGLLVEPTRRTQSINIHILEHVTKLCAFCSVTSCCGMLHNHLSSSRCSVPLANDHHARLRKERLAWLDSCHGGIVGANGVPGRRLQ